MNRIKKWESFNFDQTLPVTTKNFLNSFYSCDECDSIWKEFNNTAERCVYCDSNEIEELEESEYYEIAKSKGDIESLKSEQPDSEEVVDLFHLKKSGKNNVN
jgi:hypothetical protein